MDDAVVDVQVARMVRVDGVRCEPVDELLDDLHDVEQRHDVEAVVRQVVEEEILHAESLRGARAVALEVVEEDALRLLSLRVARRDPLTEDRGIDVFPLRREPRHRPPGAEHLVVRVRCDDENAHTDASWPLKITSRLEGPQLKSRSTAAVKGSQGGACTYCVLT